MITLYQEGWGSGRYWVEEAADENEWNSIKQAASDILRRRGDVPAADLLENGGFKLHKGANDFGDDFDVLYRAISLQEYADYDEISRAPERREPFKTIAKTVGKLGRSVRFVGVEMVQVSTPAAVASPSIANSQAVVAALDDAELLLAKGRPTSAVDRAHTALHGYLREISEKAGLSSVGEQLELTGLVKRLREQHPRFVDVSAHKEQTTKVLRGIAAVCDALNPLRNAGSLAHPNQDLLSPADAMLAINACRSIMRYVHDKIGSR